MRAELGVASRNVRIKADRSPVLVSTTAQQQKMWSGREPRDEFHPMKGLRLLLHCRLQPQKSSK